MTNDIKISREQLERWTTGRVSLSHLEEMRALLAAPVVERQEPVAFDAKHALTQALSAYESMSGRHLMPAGISEHQDQFIHGFLAGASSLPHENTVVLPDLLVAAKRVAACDLEYGNTVEVPLEDIVALRKALTKELNQ